MCNAGMRIHYHAAMGKDRTAYDSDDENEEKIGYFLEMASGSSIRIEVAVTL